MLVLPDVRAVNFGRALLKQAAIAFYCRDHTTVASRATETSSSNFSSVRAATSGVCRTEAFFRARRGSSCPYPLTATTLLQRVAAGRERMPLDSRDAGCQRKMRSCATSARWRDITASRGDIATAADITAISGRRSATWLAVSRQRHASWL